MKFFFGFSDKYYSAIMRNGIISVLEEFGQFDQFYNIIPILEYDEKATNLIMKMIEELLDI